MEVDRTALLLLQKGRRLGIERRKFTYTEHVPERRSGKDRRSGTERRSAVGLLSRLHGRTERVVV
jgi:CRP-like cAMP-binding protein